MFELQLTPTQSLQLPEGAFLSLLSNTESFIFIKDTHSQYKYGNPAFLDLMGLKSLKYLLKKVDLELCRDKKKAAIYRRHDEEVIENESVLSVSEEVLSPKGLRKQMEGKIYPIFAPLSSKPIAVMGVVKPRYLSLRLTLEMAVSMSKEEMERYFLKRSYPVNFYEQEVKFSKRELQCIIGLIQGKSGREIADMLHLQQTTIEFYLENIKNKLGATSKSSLISTVFNQKILQQIIL